MAMDQSDCLILCKYIIIAIIRWLCCLQHWYHTHSLKYAYPIVISRCTATRKMKVSVYCLR